MSFEGLWVIYQLESQHLGMMHYGKIRSGLGDRPIVERSLSVTRVVLYPFPVGDIRGVEISVF